MKTKKVILDTNLWISFLITGNYSKLDRLLDSDDLKLVFSLELIEEFISVAKRPKLTKYFKESDLEGLLKLFDNYGIIVEVNSDLDLCRDTKDNFLLNLAVDGKVDYLVTGDKDLLILEKIEGTKIITITELLDFFP